MWTSVCDIGLDMWSHEISEPLIGKCYYVAQLAELSGWASWDFSYIAQLAHQLAGNFKWSGWASWKNLSGWDLYCQLWVWSIRYMVCQTLSNDSAVYHGWLCDGNNLYLHVFQKNLLVCYSVIASPAQTVMPVTLILVWCCPLLEIIFYFFPAEVLLYLIHESMGTRESKNLDSFQL